MAGEDRVDRFPQLKDIQHTAYESEPPSVCSCEAGVTRMFTNVSTGEGKTKISYLGGLRS